MRFDAPEHVTAWARARRYPAIHDAITSTVRAEISPRDGTLLDLCSSTGLLGRRLLGHGYQVCAAQEPSPALTIGQSAGVYNDIPLLTLRIAPDTVGDLLRWVEEQDARTVVARRCFPELWDALGPDEFEVLARGLVEAGVTRIVLEGRVTSVRSTHPLASAADEVKALSTVWRCTSLSNPTAVLEPC